ncbi:MAG: hypothetical protein H9W81_13675 [Enterococcus sp.]|nr:hypothetical protein [Enterococcus sp.]
MAETETKMAFRKFDNGEIIALFVEDVDTRFGSCESYMFEGEHSPADLNLIDELEPATEEEYRALKLTLEARGYLIAVQ